MKFTNWALLVTIGFGLSSAVQAQNTAEQLETRFESSSGQTLFLSSVSFTGNESLSDSVLLETAKPFLNRRIDPLEAFGIADAVTKAYRDAGYSLSRAFIPEQSLDPNSRAITVAVVEGYIDQVQFPDEVRKYRNLYRDYERQILQSRPLKSARIERVLRLMNDLPGLQFSAVLKASTETAGATTLVLRVNEDRFSGSLAIDNKGAENSGPHQMRVSVTANNLIGIHDQITATYAASGVDENGSSKEPEYEYRSINYTNILNAEGTKLSITGTESTNKPHDGTLAALDYESTSNSTALEISHPLYLSNKGRLDIAAGFEARNSEAKMLGSVSQADRLRIASAKVSGEYSFLRGVSRGAVEVRQGIDGLGSTSNGSTLHSRNDGVVDFTKLTLETSRNQNLVGPLSVKTSAKIQYTDDALLASEECGFGGNQFGRAYADSVLSGDRCRLLGIEGVYRLPQQRFYSFAELYGFYDHGEVSNKDASGNWQSDDASTGGVGLRAAADNLSATLEYTASIDEPATATNKEDRLTFSAVLNF